MRLFPVLLFVTALLIAGNAAYFSVKGIGLLFAGSFLSVIVMASSLEIGKLIAVSFIYRKWKELKWLMRLYLSVSVLMLMGITSLGIYGFLSDAYQDTKTKVELYETEITSLIAENGILNKQIESANTSNNTARDKNKESIQNYTNIYKELSDRIKTQIESYNDQISKMDQVILSIQSEKSGFFSDKQGRLNKTREAQAPEREFIKAEISKLESKLDEEYKNFLSKVDKIDQQVVIKVEEQDISKLYDRVKSNESEVLSLKQKIGDTDIGSFKFIAKVLDVETDVAVKWFIFVIVLVFDPLAVCLMIGYNMYVMNTPYDGYKNDDIEDEPSGVKKLINKVLPAKTPRDRQYYK